MNITSCLVLWSVLIIFAQSQVSYNSWRDPGQSFYSSSYDTSVNLTCGVANDCSTKEGR